MQRTRIWAVGMIAGTLLRLGIAGAANAEDWQTLAPAGYAVFEYSIMQNLPVSHVPEPAHVLRKVSCTLARDEYESVHFGVHALADGINDITVTVESDLKVTVYHRMSAAVKAELASQSEQGTYDVARWVPIEMHLQRGNVFPELPRGRSVGFWLTFRAEAGAREGLHRGKIRVQPAGRPETVLDLELTVRPFQLGRPRAAFGLYFREDMLPTRFNRLHAPRESVLAMFRDMAAHGQNSSWFYPAGDYTQGLPPKSCHVLEKLLPLAEQAGLLDPAVPVWMCGGGFTAEPDRVNKEQLQALISWLQAERRQRGWPEIVHYFWDEPPYPSYRLREIATRLRTMRVRIGTSLDLPAAYGHSDMYDAPAVLGGGVTPEMQAEARRQGVELWTYSYRIWREGFHPFRQRYYAGLYTWALELKGNFVWAYHHGHHRHAWFPPNNNEPMPVTGWEARREGVDDYRYLQMLGDSVAADTSKPLARQAALWLEALKTRLAAVDPHLVEAGKPLALAEYDEIREKAAGYIKELGPVRNEAVVRAPAPRLRDEAAAFRGRTVEECIAGLASPDAVQRRGAAWALFEQERQAAPAVAPLVRALDDSEVRIPALHALEAIGPDAFAAVPKIKELVSNPDRYIRMGAILALSEIGCPLADREAPKGRSGRRAPSRHAALVVEPLTAALHDDCDEIVSRVANVLAAMGSLAGPALPEALKMLDAASPSGTQRSAAVRVITGLGPAAAEAVPRLIEMHKNKRWGAEQLNALAAIGPAASAAVPALVEYAAKEAPGHKQATAYYALFCVRGELPDLRKMVEPLKDTQVSDRAKEYVVKFLNRLGAKAEAVAEEIRGMLESEAVAKWAEDLQAFLEKVEKGEVPGPSLL